MNAWKRNELKALFSFNTILNESPYSSKPTYKTQLHVSLIDGVENIYSRTYHCIYIMSWGGLLHVGAFEFRVGALLLRSTADERRARGERGGEN